MPIAFDRVLTFESISDFLTLQFHNNLISVFLQIQIHYLYFLIYIPQYRSNDISQELVEKLGISS